MSNIRMVSFLALALFVAVRCRDTETPPAPVESAGATAIETRDKPVAAEGKPSASDDLAADVAKANKLIVGYRGDGAVLSSAKDILMSVLTRDRNYASAYVELARLEYKAGYISNDDFERTRLINADKFLRHAFKLDPDLTEGLLLQASVKLRLGEFDEAEKSLEAAASHGASAAALDAGRARLAAAYRDEKEAFRYARSVIANEASPDVLKVEMLTFMAGRLDYTGYRAEAQAAYEQVVAIDPTDAWGQGNLASFLLNHGETVRAMEHAERAVKITPYPIAVRTLARAYVTRAEELHKEKRFDEAARLIERLGKTVGADNPDVDQMLGNYYRTLFVRTSDLTYLDRAIARYRAVLATDPDRTEVAGTLQQLVERRAKQ